MWSIICTIIPKEQYDQTILKDGDEVEIVSFMGGGC
ncbi:MAG: sulfur carrier protein ThiS [Anaerobutyricum soehngenii]